MSIRLMAVPLMSFCLKRFTYYVNLSNYGSSNDGLSTMSVRLMDGLSTMSVRLLCLSNQHRVIAKLMSMSVDTTVGLARGKHAPAGY